MLFFKGYVGIDLLFSLLDVKHKRFKSVIIFILAGNLCIQILHYELSWTGDSYSIFPQTKDRMSNITFRDFEYSSYRN